MIPNTGPCVYANFETSVTQIWFLFIENWTLPVVMFWFTVKVNMLQTIQLKVISSSIFNSKHLIIYIQTYYKIYYWVLTFYDDAAWTVSYKDLNKINTLLSWTDHLKNRINFKAHWYYPYHRIRSILTSKQTWVNHIIRQKSLPTDTLLFWMSFRKILEYFSTDILSL